MTISAVVVSYNSAGHLTACLSALRRSNVDQIVVVDNGSTDDSIREAQAIADSVLSGHGNVGYGTACNFGAASLSCETVLFVNPDCIVEDGAVSSVVQVLADHGDVGAAAPAMVYTDGSAGISGGPAPSLLKEWLAAHDVDERLPAWTKRTAARLARSGRGPRLLQYAEPRFFEGIRDFHWVSGYCMAVRMSAFLQISGFDPRFFLYFEDVDLCKRLADVGWRIVCVGDARATHIESVSTSPVGKGAFYGAGLRSYYEKHGSGVERVSASLLARRMA